MKTKILISLISVLILFSGCAIKKNDTKTQKALKHTANSPIYAGALLYKAIEKAAVITVGGAIIATKAVTGNLKKEDDNITK